MTKLEEFYQYYKITDKPGPEQIQGKAKTADSIFDKVVRNVEQNNKDRDFVVANISDLSRCAVVFENYGEIQSFILKLKQTIPQIDGYISRHPNGYRGIHLNFTLDGIKTEIQLTTHKAWEYAQATEKIYAKWRSVDFAKIQEEIHQLEIERANAQDPELQNSLTKQISKKSIEMLELQNKMDFDNDMTRDVYKELNSDGEFDKYVSNIESTLLMFKLSKSEEPAVEIPKEFNEKFSLTEDFKVDKEEAIKKIEKCCKYTDNVQTKLISLVQKAIDIKELDQDNLLDYNRDREFLENILIHYDKVLEKYVDPRMYQDNMLAFSKQKSNLAIEVTRFAKQNNLTSLGAKEVINKFIKHVEEKYPQQVEAFSISKLIDKLEQQNQYQIN